MVLSQFSRCVFSYSVGRIVTLYSHFQNSTPEAHRYQCSTRYELITKMRTLCFIIALGVASVCHAATPELRFAWNQLSYAWDSEEARDNAIKDGRYIPENNIPVGVARWKNKVFLGLPRWRRGVLSTLNYVDLDGPQDQLVKPYPSFENNYVADTATELPLNSSLVSVFRVFPDACDRLWMVDTGRAGIIGDKHQVTGPSIVVFDLNTDKFLFRYTLKPSDVPEKNLFGNIIVDVTKDTCDDAYAYLPDLSGFGVVVYSLKENDSWRIEHHYFHIDPLNGAYNGSGIDFQWTDGVFSLALSNPNPDGYRTAYFHSFSSTTEFYVSTEILKNYRNYNDREVYFQFKVLGDRGPHTQAASSVFDPETEVVFYTLVNLDGVSCWNTKKPFTQENNAMIFRDSELYEFPIDIKLDEDGVLWTITDKLPRFFYTEIDPNEVNYKIYSINAKESIKGTTCE